ncbi:MAG: chemotaxis protein CheD [Spirochaetia bacterium]|nr:chemotaxis protein CheD [Spirochaetia bacterium]
MPSIRSGLDNTLIAGIGEVAVTREEGVFIKTLALGTCVAVVFWDPVTHLSGLVHVALPESSISPEKARELPGYFADTGIHQLHRIFVQNGYLESSKTLQVRIAGGAQIMDKNETFNIGKRNVLAVKKILWSLGLGPIAEEVGGDRSRTVVLERDTGRMTISTPGLPEKTL